MDKTQQRFFTKQLMQWHRADNERSLPWKEEKDPYKIWLSEIILQQTRAQQGLPYYLRFMETYPTISDMAGADDEEVFRIWQGLGYYNRCRNMLATARYIAGELKGHFPATHDAILALKGVGPYTAAAIASFAFGLLHAVVDGNVYRVLSRYFGIATPIDSTEGKQQFTELAEALLDKNDSAAYNQAIMDLGATVCKPAAPECEICPVSKNCIAYKNGLVAQLPVKAKKLKVSRRYFHYIIFKGGEQIWIRKRTGKDIWQNLYEPFMVEAEGHLAMKDLIKTESLQHYNLKTEQLEYEGKLSQRLTHRIIESHFYTCDVKKAAITLPEDGKWVNLKQLHNYAFPKSILSFFEKKAYFYYTG